MKLFDKIAEIQESDNINHITVPRWVLFALILLSLVIFTSAVTMCRGILVVAAVPVFVFWAMFIYLTYGIWKKYYSLVSYAVIIAAEIFASFFLAHWIRTLTAYIVK